MNASAKTTALNAYVTGVGASKRVVVYDTLLAKSSEAGVLLTFGHEMGHYVLHHIPKELAIDLLVLLVLLYLLYRLAGWMINRWGVRWGIRELRDWASLAVLILALNVVGFFADPVFNGISRHFEHEADRYALEVLHGIVPNENQADVKDFEMDGEINLDDPDPNPFIKFWLFDHPSLPERIAFVGTYNPWREGESPKYVK
jgi:Zn-dependent protease with chaperone function